MVPSNNFLAPEVKVLSWGANNKEFSHKPGGAYKERWDKEECVGRWDKKYVLPEWCSFKKRKADVIEGGTQWGTFGKVFGKY